MSTPDNPTPVHRLKQRESRRVREHSLSTLGLGRTPVHRRQAMLCVRAVSGSACDTRPVRTVQSDAANAAESPVFTGRNTFPLVQSLNGASLGDLALIRFRPLIPGIECLNETIA